MKITIENGAGLDRILITKTGAEWGEYSIIKNGEFFKGTFPMPEGDGFLEIHV